MSTGPIKDLFQQVPSDCASLSGRIIFFSRCFLGAPYLAGALGEGIQGEFDQFPLYRHDAFDCVTYVNTVLALSHATGLKDFVANMLKLNYRYAKPRYEDRYHFISVDWNPLNAAKGFITDVTSTFVDESQQPVSLIAEAMIDRVGWYAHRTQQDIRLQQPLDAKVMEQKLQNLRALGRRQSAELNQMPYLPLKKLFIKQQPNEFLFNQLPELGVIEIVRPNWDLVEKIGTHLQISHMGFVFKHDGRWIFRHASQLHKKVVDEDLIDYLRRCLESPTIKGINVQLL